MKIITSEEFTKEQSDFVTQIITDSVKRITPFIPLVNILFKVFLDENKTIPEQGVCGYAPDDKEIELYLAPERESDWQAYLPITIAHEWHHVARWRGHGYGETIAEAIISEGLAQRFEETCYPGPPSHYSIGLKEEDRKIILNEFIKEFNSKEYDHSIWFFGREKFPFLAGYDLSYFVIGEYLKINMSSPEKEVNLMPEQLLPILQKLKNSSC